MFHHAKGVPIYDPIMQGRTKQLFDVVTSDGRGWSLKTLLWGRLDAGTEFEFVIQRADIFTKAIALGFLKGLSVDSAVHELGTALVKHWNEKYLRDKTVQKVTDPRIAILLKNGQRRRFVYVEFAYPPLDEKDFTWVWSREGGRGLKGIKDGKVHFKWYYGQKQLFQVFRIPPGAYSFEVNWKRADLASFVAKTRNGFAK